MKWIRFLIALLGLAVIVALPWIWPNHLLIAAGLVFLLVPWSMWLMVEYLRWARGLGK